MRDSFVFYKSFLTSISLLPASKRLEAYEGLARCSLGEITPDELKYPVNALVAQMIASVKAAQDRHDKAEEDGKKGGRPRKGVDQEEAEALFAELGTWSAVAEKLDVSENTLLKARRVWEAQKRKNLKNLNVNDNVNGNVNVNDNYQLTNINNKASDGTRLEAVPPPRGYEWSGDVFTIRGTHYRECIRKETGEEKVVQLD